MVVLGGMEIFIAVYQYDKIPQCTGIHSIKDVHIFRLFSLMIAH